jgi:hypothetical protein
MNIKDLFKNPRLYAEGGLADSIPAVIDGQQPAAISEGEYIVPADVVSMLGDGSTDAGAKRLYAMMDRIKARRKKTKDIAADSKAYNLLPAYCLALLLQGCQDLALHG